MVLNTKVTESDLITVWDDLSRGDMVYLDAYPYPIFGVVTESQESRLVVETMDRDRIFDAQSEPSLSQVLAGIQIIPNFQRIEPGILMSRINKNQQWMFREYVKIISVHRNSGALNTVKAEVLNGQKKGQVYIFCPEFRPITEELAGWQIED